jgi:hypothetical protein
LNYLIDDSKEGSLQFNELNVNFSKPINDAFHVGFGLSARNLGALYNNEMTLSWAYGDYHYKDYLGLRMGRIKTPVGLFNETRDMDMFRTGIILPGAYPEAYRDFLSFLDGAGVYGTIPVPYIGNFLYQVNMGTQDASADGGTGSYLNERLRVLKANVHNIHLIDKSIVMDLKWETPIPGLMLGETYYTIGDVELPTSIFHPLLGAQEATLRINDLLVCLSSLKYSYNNFTFISEYMNFEMENNVTTNSGMKLVKAKPVFIESWYFNPSYRFTEWFEVGAYYSEFYPTKYERSEEYLKDICLSLRFDINESWLAKLEWHQMKGIGYVPQSYNPDEAWATDDLSDEEWTLFAAKVTFNF